MYRIGQLSLSDNVQKPDIGVDESGSSEGEGALHSCAVGGSLCHSEAVCVDYSPGFCCSCGDDYLGNGINCIRKGQPIRVTGRVIGNLNGVKLQDLDLHSYVLTSEGRTYTAISRVPSQIGYDLQSITAIATGIAWLFANPITNVANGFQNTGGNFNRTVEVDFPQTGHRVEVQQQFNGLDVFNYVQVKTQITGSIPTIPVGSEIEMDAFNEEYTRVKAGQLRARSSRIFRLKGQTIDTPFRVETTIDYDECEWKDAKTGGQETLRLKVPENIFIQYDSTEEIVRYALSAKLAPLEEVDPCVEGRQECGENSQCVVDGDTYRCVCARGYEEVYDATLNQGICLDLNECSTSRDNCHANAICKNTPGSFICSCKPHFTGDGLNCEKTGSCEGIPCDPNAVCELHRDHPQCVCRPGFTGDGLICTKSIDVPLVNEQRTCMDYDICSPFAECAYDDSVRSFRCVCLAGYTGDGQTCAPSESCDTARNCSPYAVCTKVDTGYRCECIRGFTGDGYMCEGSDTVVDISYQPEQPYQPEEPQYPYQPDPYQPEDPQQPYQPDPYQPEDPQQPYQPDPYQPDYPYQPEDPQQPYQPEDPQQPYQPDYPYQPEDPQQPYQPEEPQYPYQPDPQQPYQPEEPQYPYQPEDPQQPYQPEEPQYPYQPDPQQPDYPYRPDPQQPDYPYRPDPQQPDYPYQPDPQQPDYPYQPDPQQPDYPFQPQKPLSEIQEPECLGGVCWCPFDYTLNSLLNQCELKSTLTSQDREDKPETPEPYCGAAKCTCPKGFVYDATTHTCNTQVTETDEDLLARPLPGCFSGKCSCPLGYFYDYSQHACLTDPSSGYNYDIQGGGGRGGGGGGQEQEQTVSCHDVNRCHPNAQCTYSSYTRRYSCQCNAGYDGDGYQCSKLDVSCDRVDICHIHAQCLFDDQTLQHVCVCITGYQGDGIVCTPQDECSSVADCDINAQCLYDSASQRYKCSCNEGYEGDGHYCTTSGATGCNIVNTCDVNANCIYDTYALAYRCQCLDGYEGDGLVCSPAQIGCNVLQNCGENAVCSYSIDDQGYRCACQEGFEGDGFFCKPTRSCQLDPSLCHPQAVCVPDAASKFGYACRCQEGYTGDGLNCLEAVSHERDILLFNQGLAVLRMPVDPRGGRSYIIHFEAFMTAVGADIDCLAGRYYWTDVRSSSIRSSKYDGTQRQPTVAQGSIGFPEDVAVDWISKNVYWTDSASDVVSVASVEDGKQRTVIKEGLVNPRGIAVHPGFGLLFWSDWNRLAPKIESSGLDGSNRKIIVSEDVSLPNSLVVDYETETLCWADAGTHKIECVSVMGGGRRVVTRGPHYPFGLTILGQNFYYTDWNDTKIHTVDRYSGVESASRAPPPGGSGKLYGISAVPPSCPPISNVCGVDDGGCPSTHLCLPNSSGGRTCACTDLLMQDEESPCADFTY